MRRNSYLRIVALNLYSFIMSEPKKNTLSERAVAFSVDALLGFKENTNGKSFTSQTCVQDSGTGNQIDQCFAAMNTFGSQGIGMELIDKALWTQFHNLGNEMIITKSGRRTFPALKVHVSGLDLDSSYIIWLDIVPMDQLRYRYVYSSSKWTVAAMEGDVLGSPAYIHPDSPASGRHWMSQPITFDKLKLTNCKNPTSVLQVPLRSMHKYQPRIHIQKAMGARENPYLEVNSSLALTFTFAETQFITVTAYQNQQITRLKIASNPFAKGFREVHKSSPRKEEPDCCSSNCFLVLKESFNDSRFDLTHKNNGSFQNDNSEGEFVQLPLPRTNLLDLNSQQLKNCKVIPLNVSQSTKDYCIFPSIFPARTRCLQPSTSMNRNAYPFRFNENVFSKWSSYNRDNPVYWR